MAEIRKVVPSAGVSNFQQVAAEGGGAFRLLAEAANTAYDFLKPLADQQITDHQVEAARAIAKQQIGDPALGSGGSSSGSISASLSRTESGGNYQAQNSEGFTGKYQWGQGRLDDYNAAQGTSYSLAQFKASPDVQEAAQKWHEGDILSQIGGYAGTVVKGIVMTNAAIIAAAHLGGIGGARKFITSGGAYDPADNNGTKLSDYAKTHGGAGSGGTSSEPPTMIREADGKLTSRLYSPLNSQVSAAASAAAGAAYQSEMMVKGFGDLMGISEQFPLDPTGYQQAAQGYVDGIVDKAPDMFKADLRTSLERETKARTLGMKEEQHRDFRQRANNASTALMEKWSDNLAAAVAGGNPDEIAAAQGELDSVLVLREALPGAAWTPEQSDNVRIKALDAGQRAIETQQNDQKSKYKAVAAATIAAANAGLYAADENMLDNPEFAALLPDEHLKAKAAQTRREAMPGFTAAPSADRKAALAEIEAIPFTTKEDVAAIEAFRDADKTVSKAFDDSPMDAANTYLPNKPPAFPDLTGDPATVIAALQGRADYARSLKTNGYSKYTAFLTDAEAETLGATLGKDTPTEIKAAILGTLVAGFEGDAGRVLSEAKINDPVMVFSGQLMASGGDKSVVEGALRGQQMLDEGLIQRPSKAISVAAISPDIAAALSVIPEAQASEAGLIKFALAIYANDARGVDPNSDDATKRMDTAINKALGQSTNRRGQVTGGVQKMRGNDVLLPVGVAGEDVNGALEAAFGASPNTYLGQVDTYWSRITSIGRVAQDNPAQPDIWTSAGISSSKGSMPMMGGKPLDPKHFRNGNIRIVPIPKSGPAAYRMEYVSGNGFVGDVLDASGSVYQFDIKALIEASAP